MIKITLDTQAIAKHFKQSATEVVETAVNVLGEVARDMLTAIVEDRVSIDQQKRYLRAIKTEREKLKITIYLDDAQIERLEAGFPGFDIKPGLLGSRKAKRSASGDPYIDVPFRHRTHKRASGKGAVVPPGSERKTVEKAMQIAAATGSNVRAFRGQPSIRGDMVVKPTGELFTFRRVSKNTDPSKWRHPGLPGVGAFEATAQEIAKIAPQVLERVAKARGLT